MNRIDEIKKELETMEETKWELERELSKLEAEEKEYYIGVSVHGDEDYWDEYFHTLGFVSTAKAKEWLDGQTDEYDYLHSDCKIFSVNKETYDLYHTWWLVSQAESTLSYGVSIDVSDVLAKLRSKEAELIKTLEIKFPSFQHPGRPIGL